MQAAAGAILALLAASAAYRLRLLTLSGACAAFVIGVCVFGQGGWRYALVLFAFFIPSAVLSRVGRARKSQLVDVGKSGARDGRQVLANGAVAAACALAGATNNHIFGAAFAGAFATAAADTWGTEIGTLAGGTPRSILTLTPVARGLSGGITTAGTIAELAGAAAVAAVASILGVAPFWAVAVGGCIGALADSVLGARLQLLRFCARCSRECEIDPHVCGSRTRAVRGWAWMDNDAVNASATLIGAAIAALLATVR